MTGTESRTTGDAADTPAPLGCTV
uniref:Uncharacterized protein n=1 Tax=Arundo donax TaxID=35708 RepID=A0A0A8ZRR4_ARUDO